MSANDLKHVPRIVPMAVAASVEAVADAGLRPDGDAARRAAPLRRRHRLGGAGLEFIEKQFRQYYLDDPKGVSLYTIPSSTPGIAVERAVDAVSALRGPSHVISTGCTSSTDAIGHAMSLDPLRPRRPRARRRQRLADRAGDPSTGFCLMKIMSTAWNDEPERASRPFSKDRDGFVIAEGSWMMVLEERETRGRARRPDLRRGRRLRRDRARRSTACGSTRTARSRRARCGSRWRTRGLDPDDVDYLNLHGTSTQLNDRIETRAVKMVFGERATTIPVVEPRSR